MQQDDETRDEQIDRWFKNLGARIYAVECMVISLCLRQALALSKDPKTEVEGLINDAHHIMNQFNLSTGAPWPPGIADARVHLYNRLNQVKSNMDTLLSSPSPPPRQQL